MNYKNTLQKGSVRYLVFKEDDIWYGVALEFNIVEEGEDPQLVLFNLLQAIQGYVKSLRKIKARQDPLNQIPEREYEVLWNEANRSELSVKSPFSVYTFGTQIVST
ncbi:MAG TPA: hypothetical protein VJJ22_01780 [Candidatus Paceibacterota bacterium]